MDESKELQGIDVPAVEGWYAEHVPGTQAPLQFDLVAGGHSNLTFRVTDAGGKRTVLRRPPLGQVLASAHDMGREHRVISALADSPVPVPHTYGLEATGEVNDGATFYVMDFVDGFVLRDAPAVERELSPEARARAGRSLVEVLAALHAVDPASVGLGDLGRTEGYIARQLSRWHGQFHKSKTRELPAVDQVHDRLVAAIPEQGPAAIVHGDYRLDNCLIGPDGNVVSVLDWELCTLGDPMADVGLLMCYWSEPGDTSPTLGAPTLATGMATRAELLDAYAAASGRDLADVNFYVAFGYWKLACILEGVYARYVGGAMGDRDPSSFDGFARQVEELAHQAVVVLDSDH